MTTPVQLIAPRAFDTVGGFLGQRFHANREGHLKDTLLSEEFIRLHERKTHTIFHWTKACDDWFWLGEQIGKWLDASAYTALIADDHELLTRVHELIKRPAKSQEMGLTVFVFRGLGGRVYYEEAG